MAPDVQRTAQWWSVGPTRIRWSAVFAGLAIGMATEMLLTLLGLAVGAWSIDLQEAQPARGVPLGTGIWTALSVFIAALIGGYTTARLAGITLRSDGMYHGAVVWAVSWLVLAWLTTTALSFMVGGLFNALGTAVQTLGQGISTAVARAAGAAPRPPLSIEDLRRHVEAVLAATGKQELQPGEVRKDIGRITGEAQRGKPLSEVGESAWAELQHKLAALDREAATKVLINQFGMSEPQARQVVQSTISLVEPMQQAAQTVRERSAELANRALSTIGATAGWLFLLALLSLGLSVWGGALGSSPETAETAALREPYEARRTG